MAANNSNLAERLEHAVRQGMLSEQGEHVLRMRHGITVAPDAPLGIKPGLLRNPGSAAAVTEMEQFLVQRGRELRGATPHGATEALYGHGAHLGDDAEGEAIRLATGGVLH